ncbi:MAG: CCA tRNA nucleotidyltransferase [Candidatus Gracilibacteria bacterium]|nr:CCA tRNA nucleotidyltransferase [bacterium]MDZ4217234.1 CCA tRNA nucleotidyltransferase [Candidatus Gracilibacteria bacterium]
MKDIQQIVHHYQDLLDIKLYLVGGSVRDKLLNIPHTDLDFTTPTQPDDIEAAVKKAGFKPFIIGKRFGTVAFKDLHSFFQLSTLDPRPSTPNSELRTPNSELIEITTFRTETYGKTRKPQVEFVQDITADLSRRDFTVNAMAIDDEGRLIDPFEGYADLKAEKIRFVGNPSVRINEDPLRMLRACRLSAQFDFVPTTETKLRITQNAHKILNISKERWTSEMDKILTSRHPHRGLDMLVQTELLRYILPEIWIQYHYDQNSPYHRLSLFEHTKKTVQMVENDINIRWAALLHDVGKPFTRADKTISKHLFNITGLKESVKRLWKRDTQANYPHHAELGAEFVEKIGKHLRWSTKRIETTKKMVLNHLKGGSPIGEADSNSR